MATYAVGDIQGCLEPLQCLLREVSFNPDRDMLWSVGDSVNRGPQCLETLRFLHDMRDNLVMVLGNHDLHLLAVAAGAKRPSASDTLDRILEAPDRDTLLNWLVQRPMMHHEHGYTLVHAGIPPQWSLQDALGYAAEVETALRGPLCTEFLSSMYGNEPLVWDDTLTGMTRLRVITNYLTRMRFCTKKGLLDLQSKGRNPESARLGDCKVDAWFAHKKRRTAGERILFGHWATLEGCTNSSDVIGLDTGCVWGGALSMYELDSARWFRCACRQGRCRD